MKLNTQIERNRGYSYLKIETDKKDRLRAAINEVAGSTYYVTESYKIQNSVKRLFESHGQFYDYIGFDAGREHGVTGESFDTDGWFKFIKQFFSGNAEYLNYIDDPDDLQLITDAIAQRLADILEEYESDDNEGNYVAKSQIKLDTHEPEELKDPELLEEALLIGKDSTHKIQVKELADAKNLDDVQQEVRENSKEVYKTQLDTRVRALKQQVSDLQEKLEEEKEEMLVEGMRFADNLENWKVEDGFLVYQKRINAEVATETRYNNETPKKLTEEAREKFWIDGLKVPLKPTIRKVKYEDAYHPHALDHGGCTGSFNFPLKEGLDRVVEQMKQINLHRTANNDSERELKENFDEYTTEEVTGEVWTA